MIVSSVTLSNLKFLYDTIMAAKQNDGKYLTRIGGNLSHILDKISITFHISEATAIDIFFLKRYANDNITILDAKYEAEDFFSTEGEHGKSGDKLNKLYTYLVDTFINNMKDGSISTTLLPAYALKYEAEVIYSGSSLLRIIEGVPELFFKKLKNQYGIESDEWEDMISIRKDGEEIHPLEAYITSVFLQNHYNSMMENTMSKDMLTDFMIKKTYLDKNVFSLPTLSTPYGYYELTGDFTKILSELKEKYCNKGTNYIKKTFFLLFSGSSTFSTFLEICNILPSRCVMEYDDFRIVENKTDFIYPDEKEISELKGNVTAIMNTIAEERASYFGTDNNLYLQKISSINMNARIHYLIKVSMQDIQDMLNNEDYKALSKPAEGIVFTNYREESDILNKIRDWGITLFNNII